MEALEQILWENSVYGRLHIFLQLFRDGAGWEVLPSVFVMYVIVRAVRLVRNYIDEGIHLPTTVIFSLM